MAQFDFSVIMPTYNSEKTIGKALASIRQQKYDQTKIEILVIDGGSTDQTLAIAKEFQVRTISNPKRLPEEAKKIGLLAARGSYYVFQDSDEEIVGEVSFAVREVIFRTSPQVNNIIPSGLRNPPGYSAYSEYTNVVGDPFSYFMKRQDGSDLYASYQHRLKVLKDGKEFSVFQATNDILPILDAGGHTVRAQKNAEFHAVFVDTFLETKQFAVLKNSYTNHYSSSSFGGILKKIDFRVRNNLQKTETAGYANREAKSILQTMKQFAFLLYGVTLIVPFIEGIYLSFSKRNSVFLLLPIFAFYTVSSILWNMISPTKSEHYG